ncbi:glucose-repressible alcohol dehydrogenase transcriptional effector [Sodiomyces alkalinus F11]|uniref:CCR4-Not complex 3'-5'-exoribonuclease subunit Ccr4 n=1 Tax=Sodiomyces alkalinus (strain CBS 110278 / VKM F-3762 / F11) TaxID=1314773 RepID=A0A3N2PZG6_SODAK|nr:glucose-repressible alcohol dehydrogenase transcriptional effector [Sodiomyces alkalinus F11]ROT39882.1 glucose-repressible alcohol dehydrogenase transcriptional effector [Sodiomyces alkalinus F11]
MFSQNHQQGHSSRLNGGGLGGQRIPLPFNYQQGQHHQQSHLQHHQSVQQDHTGHNGNGGAVGHHSNYSSGVLSNATPFTPSGLQNGHVGTSTTTRGGQAQPINEHWAEQLRLHKEAERAHAAMTEQAQPHYYARLKASENKGISYPSPAGKASSGDSDTDDRRRPYSVDRARNHQAWHNLDMSGQGLRNLTPALFAYSFLSELYIASNKLTHLPASIGQLRQLRHLEASYNQITELPPELGMCTYLKELLLFNNNIRTLPYELGSLHLLEQLGIEGNPLSPDLKQEIVERGTKSLINLLKEQSPVPPPPAPRKFITVQEDVSASLERIKVFSWNVLCDKYATPQTYGYTPTGALSWEYRKECVMEELRDKDADFLCLQEISTESFKEELSPALAQMDYKGVHWPKTRAKTMGEKDALGVDGCATFFKASKYILLDKQVIEFAAIAINRPDMKNQHDVFNRVMPKDNIAVVCFLESRATGARVILVNGHLAWESVLADVKVIQTGILMEQIAKYAERWVRWPAVKDKRLFSFSTPMKEGDEATRPATPQEPAPSQEYRNNTDIPLLICGDLNSTVDSSVYELLSQGRVPPDHLELAKFQYGSFTRDGIEHPFSLRDAYAHLQGTPDELPFTNYTPGFVDVIDYLWYSTNTLEVVDLLGPPDAECLKRVPAFPNYHFPSDHIQIMAEFVIKARKEKKVLPEPDFGTGSGGGDKSGR